MLVVLGIENIVVLLGPVLICVRSLVSNDDFLGIFVGTHRNRDVELTVILFVLGWWHRFYFSASRGRILFRSFNLFLK